MCIDGTCDIPLLSTAFQHIIGASSLEGLEDIINAEEEDEAKNEVVNPMIFKKCPGRNGIRTDICPVQVVINEQCFYRGGLGEYVRC